MKLEKWGLETVERCGRKLKRWNEIVFERQGFATDAKQAEVVVADVSFTAIHSNPPDSAVVVETFRRRRHRDDNAPRHRRSSLYSCR